MGTGNRYKRLFETARDGILILKADTGEMTDINPFFAELSGFSGKEIIGKKLSETALFKDIHESDKFFKKLRNKKYFRYDNMLLKTAGGKEITVEVIGNVFLEDNTKMIQCNIRDINDCKNLEKILFESEQKYRNLFEHSCEAIIISGPDSRLIDVNPAAVKMFGLRSREDMLGMYAGKLYANPEQRAAIINRLYAKGYDENFEVEMVKQDGSGQHIFTIVSAVLHKDEQGQILRVEGMLIDITERKHAIEELQQSMENFRALAENASDGITIVTGEEGRFVYANERAGEITGYTVDELLERSPRDLVIPYEFPKILKRYRRRIAGLNVIKQYDTTFIKKDGNKIRIELAPSKTIWQREPADMVLFRDISERKQIEQELKHSRDTLRDLSMHIEEARETERAKIARNLHDDLGQRLAALVIDNRWLKEKLAQAQPGITDKLNSMSELLMDAIETVQTISGELRPGILDDLGLTAAIEWQLEEFEKRTGISCELTITPEEFVVSTDMSVIIFRIVQEALTNITRHANATIVKIDLVKNENSVKLIANDNGRGIKKAEINNPKSFGIIGMKERINSLGGNFYIRGIEGKGTEIVVEIPLN